MILYEDNHLIVAVKPQNMPVQGDSSQDDDFLNEIKAYVKTKYNKPNKAFIGLVHRLDRPTGGVMVFARTSKSASRLCEQIKNKEFYKTYLAITDKQLSKQGVLKDFLVKNSNTNTSEVTDGSVLGAKEAVLEYKVIKENTLYSLIKVKLITGRHHQIRVQLSNIGAPLVGDNKYKGSKAEYLCLWAYELSFLHPITKERLCFTAKPPKYFPWGVFDEN